MTSTALPTARPSGDSIAVMIASVRTPEALPIATSDSASAPRVGFRLHEGAAAGLHVEHEGVDALGDLLAHDRRADERDALDRAGDVAQRVELLVGGRDLRGLADHGAADGRQRRLHLLEREVHAETGNRLELVERPAGMAEAAPRHHRHRHAARRGERRQDQGGLVADASGAVLVDLDAGDVAEIDAHARMHHCIGEQCCLLRGHSAQQDRHQQRGRLVVGQRAGSHTVDEEANLLARKRPPVPLR